MDTANYPIKRRCPKCKRFLPNIVFMTRKERTAWELKRERTTTYTYCKECRTAIAKVAYTQKKEQALLRTIETSR